MFLNSGGENGYVFAMHRGTYNNDNCTYSIANHPTGCRVNCTMFSLVILFSPAAFRFDPKYRSLLNIIKIKLHSDFTNL